MEEVRSLETGHGGGNEVAQQTWLAHVESHERPREGDHLEPRRHVGLGWRGRGRLQGVREAGLFGEALGGQRSQTGGPTRSLLGT